MSILQKYLNKLGLTDTTELTPNEKQDYDRWSKVLSEGDITVDKIKEFCEKQLSIIENKFKELDNTQEKNTRLITMHTVYKTIITMIDSPKSEREQLEKYLNNLIEK